MLNLKRREEAYLETYELSTGFISNTWFKITASFSKSLDGPWLNDRSWAEASVTATDKIIYNNVKCYWYNVLYIDQMHVHWLLIF